MDHAEIYFGLFRVEDIALARHPQALRSGRVCAVRRTRRRRQNERTRSPGARRRRMPNERPGPRYCHMPRPPAIFFRHGRPEYRKKLPPRWRPLRRSEAFESRDNSYRRRDGQKFDLLSARRGGLAPDISTASSYAHSYIASFVLSDLDGNVALIGEHQT